MKHCTFNSSFRKNVVAVAEQLGLTFISTNRQVQNGTLMFHDPVTRCNYSLHESGYVRRYILNTESVNYYRQLNNETAAMCGYQLNKTAMRKTKYREAKVRLLASPYEQLGILVKSVLSFRNV